MMSRHSERGQMGVTELVEAFEAAYAERRDVDWIDFLPAADAPVFHEVRRELIRVDLELSWIDGRCKRIADYLRAFPDLLDDRPALQEVAFEEYRLRLLGGDAPSPAEYEAQFGVTTTGWPQEKPESSVWSRPGFRSSLMSGADGKAGGWLSGGRSPGGRLPGGRLAGVLPELGSSFLDFELIAELGQGAFGRVYLARQGDLANRLVALKITVNVTDEDQRLARLQHTHIVPIFSVHRTGPFQAVCMPFFGATTLLDVLHSSPHDVRTGGSGKALADTIRRRRAEWEAKIVEAEKDDGAAKEDDASAPRTLRILEELSYVDAILWLGEQVAEGLAHAHDRGILHRDLKPANILLTDDGQPMLLDFNLAQDTRAARDARTGGTLPYMAPEQMEVMNGRRKAVDGRSDVYALGVVLFHLLTGRLPFPARPGAGSDALPAMIVDRQGDPPAVRVSNAAVSPAVESMIRHCLQPNLAQRYQSAHELVEDLRRHRRHLPLRHAPEPSWRERARKWMRRHPRLTSFPSVAAIAALVIALCAAPFAWSSWQALNAEARSARDREALAVQETKLARDREQLANKEAELARRSKINAEENARIARQEQELARQQAILDKEVALRAADDAMRDFREYANEARHWQRLLVIVNVMWMVPDSRSALKPDLADAIATCNKSGLKIMVADQPDWAAGNARNLPATLRELLMHNRNGLLFALIQAEQVKADFPELSTSSKEQIQTELARLHGLRDAGRAGHEESDAYLAACAAIARGDVKKAIALLTPLKRPSPHFFPGRFLLGLCHQKQMDYLEAKARFDECAEGIRDLLGRQAVETLGNGRRERGLQFARTGKRSEAAAEAELLIHFEATPQRHYEPAAIYAATIEASASGAGRLKPKDTAAFVAFDKKRAFELLGFALRHGHGTALTGPHYLRDPKLQPLRAFPEFSRLASALDVLGSGPPPRMRPFDLMPAK